MNAPGQSSEVSNEVRFRPKNKLNHKLLVRTLSLKLKA